jgi:hypothetical protein
MRYGANSVCGSIAVQLTATHRLLYPPHQPESQQCGFGFFLEDETLKNATRALELTLQSIIDARADQPRSTDLPVIDPRNWHGKPIPTREESTMEKLASDAKHSEAIATVALHWVGERLYKSGGIELMQETIMATAARNPSCGGLMMSIADSKWDGIGRTKDDAGWCS